MLVIQWLQNDPPWFFLRFHIDGKVSIKATVSYVMEIMEPELRLHNYVMQVVCTCDGIQPRIQSQGKLLIPSKKLFRSLVLNTNLLQF